MHQCGPAILSCLIKCNVSSYSFSENVGLPVYFERWNIFWLEISSSSFQSFACRVQVCVVLVCFFFLFYNLHQFVSYHKIITKKKTFRTACTILTDELATLWFTWQQCDWRVLSPRVHLFSFILLADSCETSLLLRISWTALQFNWYLKLSSIKWIKLRLYLLDC